MVQFSPKNVQLQKNNDKQLKKKESKQYWLNAKKSIIKNRVLYLMFLPVIVYYILFCYWPMYGVIIAFKDFNPGVGILDSPWVGFTHFTRFFNSYYFVRLIKNTIGISVYSLIVGLPLPIILAIMFNEVKKKYFRTTLQSISYAPNFLSTVIVVGILMFFVSPSGGIFNSIRASMGLEPINYLANPKYFWHLYVWTGIWQGIGWGSVIYSAAISGIDEAQYEAAVIDGANKFQRIWHVTIPGILPTIVIVFIMSLGGIMSVGYEKIYLMQNELNVQASEVISTYVFKSGLLGADYSFSTAVGLFNNIINFIILALTNKFAKSVGETSLW